MLTVSKNLSTRSDKVVSWFLRASALIYVLSRFVPCGPPPHYRPIEESYVQVLHKAFVERWQFGTDIAFTYGPWGFLYLGYHQGTYLLSVTVWTVLSVIFWWVGWRAAKSRFTNDVMAWLWFLGFSAMAGFPLVANLDARLMAWVLLLFLVHFFVEERPFTPMQAMLVVCLGLLGLIRFSMFITVCMVMLVVATDTVWRQRRFPWILPVFGISILFFWCVAGQYLSSLVPFLRNALRITAGYTEAMSCTNASETQDVLFFLIAGGMLGALAGYVAWQKYRFFGLLPLAGLGAVGFSIFKYGCVRHDGHEVAATIELLLVALVCQAMAWNRIWKSFFVKILVIFLPTVFIFCFSAMTFDRYSESGFFPSLAGTFGVRNLAAPLQLLRGQKPVNDAQEEYLAQLRAEFPLPHIEGSIDGYSWDQAIILANGLDYHPRPVVQSYSAYTPELEELNAASLRSEKAPDNILFEIAPIDNHFPALEDGLCWPELLTRYNIVVTNRADYPLLLKRAATPRQYNKVFLQTAAVSFGTPTLLPSSTNGPIWAEIEINKTLLGSTMATLYKPPELFLTVVLRDGRSGKFRFIPGMARAGFLLSPFVADQKSFSLLTASNGSSALAGLEVKSVTLSVADSLGGAECYQTPMRLQLYRLDYPRLNTVE